MFDVIVSGAGPAGSACAEILAKRGFHVALIEKDSKWRKPCGGAIGGKILKYYPKIKKLGYTRINGFHMYSYDYNELTHIWDDPNYKKTLIVDRLEFDNILINYAKDSGAEFFDQNTSYDFIRRNNKIIGIKTKTSSGTKEYLGKIVVIADGMSSKLAIKSGLRNKWRIEQIGTAKCAILEGKNNFDPNMNYFFYRKYGGYGWVFPLTNDRFNIGCGLAKDDILKYNLNQIYSEFISDPFIKSNFLKNNSFKEIRIGSYPVPNSGVLDKSLYSDNILIIGDAAGFVSPLDGEGIYPAVQTGIIAGRTASEAIEIDNISKQTLKKYRYNNKIKKIIRNFKMKSTAIEFFLKGVGPGFTKLLNYAKENEDFKKEFLGVLWQNAYPKVEFLTKLNDIFN